jgi:hypothetical protein
MSDSELSKKVDKEEEDYRTLLEACKSFRETGDKSGFTSSKLNSMYRDLIEMMDETGTFSMPQDLRKRRSRLTFQLADLEMRLLPEEHEDAEGDEETLQGGARGSIADISTIPDKRTPEIPAILAASSHWADSYIAEVPSSTMDRAVSHTEPKFEEGFELVRQPSSAGSRSEGDEEKKEDLDWHMV